MTTRVTTDCNGRKYITTEPKLHEQKRDWVGLTRDEISDLSDFAYNNDEEFIRNVEAKLKAKNDH